MAFKKCSALYFLFSKIILSASFHRMLNEDYCFHKVTITAVFSCYCYCYYCYVILVLLTLYCFDARGWYHEGHHSGPSTTPKVHL